MALIGEFDAPIPGENYTSDTKNYPWHRPPDFDDLDEAIEFTIKKLSKKDAAFGLMTMLDMGHPITVAARTFVLSGIGDGRWTPDFAVLLAGPVARIMMSMAKAHDITPELGLDTRSPPTKAFLTALTESKRPKPTDDFVEIDAETIQREAAEKLGNVDTGETTEAPSPRGFAKRPSATVTEEEVI